MDTPDFNEISADVIHAFPLLTVSSRLWKCLPPIIILLGKVLNSLEAALIISIKITTLFKQSIQLSEMHIVFINGFVNEIF